MKTEPSFLDIHHLVKELQTCLGARINRAHDADGILLQLHKTGAGKQFIMLTGKMLWMTATKQPTETCAGFCQLLRKYIEGKKITAIEQVGSERIIKITLATQTDTFHLIAELFSTGNIILTDKDDVILGATDERDWKDRSIQKKEPYKAPPARKDLLSLSAEDIVNDEKKLASMGFGKTLAKEVVVRGGNYQAYKSILSEKTQAREYSDGELSPIKLQQYSEEGTPYESFSALIDARLGSTREEGKRQELRRAFDQQKEKLLEVINMQLASLDKLEGKARDNQAIGEYLYQHYVDIEALLKELKGKKAEEIKKHPKVVSYDPKTQDVIVEL